MSILKRGTGTFKVQLVLMIFNKTNTHYLEENFSELTARFLKILYKTFMNLLFFQSEISVNTNFLIEESVPLLKISIILYVSSKVG